MRDPAPSILDLLREKAPGFQFAHSRAEWRGLKRETSKIQTPFATIEIEESNQDGFTAQFEVRALIRIHAEKLQTDDRFFLQNRDRLFRDGAEVLEYFGDCLRGINCKNFLIRNIGEATSTRLGEGDLDANISTHEVRFTILASVLN